MHILGSMEIARTAMPLLLDNDEEAIVKDVGCSAICDMSRLCLDEYVSLFCIWHYCNFHSKS